MPDKHSNTKSVTKDRTDIISYFAILWVDVHSRSKSRSSRLQRMAVKVIARKPFQKYLHDFVYSALCYQLFLEHSSPTVMVARDKPPLHQVFAAVALVFAVSWSSLRVTATNQVELAVGIMGMEGLLGIDDEADVMTPTAWVVH